jgi:hypothetical protein
MTGRIRFAMRLCVLVLIASIGAAAFAAGRPAGQAGTAIAARAASVQGSAWNADNTPIPEARLRLRNVNTGKIVSATVADTGGRFTFAPVEPGTYLVELVNESGRMLAVGQVFTIGRGETVATFVRLGAKVPWFSGFFSNAAAAAALAAASEGITALAPVGRPVSANK